LIEEPPQSWRWGPINKEKMRLGDLLKAIVLLKHHDLHAIGSERARSGNASTRSSRDQGAGLKVSLSDGTEVR
jgi:hypothetical protein